MMPNQPRKRPVLAWAAYFMAAAAVLLFGASSIGFLPWSPINCWHDDVDIRSGRIRHTRYLFWIPVRQSVEDSALSNALRPEDTTGVQSEWHHALTLSPGLRNSPHYVYHSAIAEIRELEIIWSLGEFTAEARHDSAKRVLQLWQQTGGDFLARKYLQALSALALTDDGQRKKIDVKDLPKL